MEIITKTPTECTEQDIDELSHLAGIGFGQGDTPAMRQDSLQHVQAADHIQFARTDERLAGFAMTRSCLWRRSC